MIVPEIIGQGLLTLGVLSTMHLFPIAVSLPMTVWVVYRYVVNIDSYYWGCQQVFFVEGLAVNKCL